MLIFDCRVGFEFVYLSGLAYTSRGGSWNVRCLATARRTESTFGDLERVVAQYLKFLYQW